MCDIKVSELQRWVFSLAFKSCEAHCVEGVTQLLWAYHAATCDLHSKGLV